MESYGGNSQMDSRLRFPIFKECSGVRPPFSSRRMLHASPHASFKRSDSSKVDGYGVENTPSFKPSFYETVVSRKHPSGRSSIGTIQCWATIDTPNFVSFKYSGCSMFKISVNAPNLPDACIKVPDYPRKTYDVDWHASLKKFLSEFNVPKNVRVFFSNEKALIIPDEVKTICSSPSPDLKLTKVQTGG